MRRFPPMKDTRISALISAWTSASRRPLVPHPSLRQGRGGVGGGTGQVEEGAKARRTKAGARQEYFPPAAASRHRSKISPQTYQFSGNNILRHFGDLCRGVTSGEACWCCLDHKVQNVLFYGAGSRSRPKHKETKRGCYALPVWRKRYASLKRNLFRRGWLCITLVP